MAELAAVVGALLGPRAWPPALAAHLAAVWLVDRSRRDDRRDARFLGAALVLALPGLALVGVSAIRVWQRRAPPSGLYAGVHSEMSELPGPDQTPEPVDRVFDWLQAQVSVQPVADLIRSADPRTQRWGVGLLARRGDAASVELLREALQAPDRDTQIAASGALQRIEERLVGRIGQTQEALRLDPDSAERLLAFGDACVAYQASGMPDAVMGRHWLGEAEAAYRRARARRPDWLPAARALARVLLALERVDEAEVLAAEAHAAEPSAEVDLLLSEVFFRQRRWRDLRALSRDAVTAGRADETLRWWAGEEPVA
ncbi:MAG TPA: HEAT repeat domain-containing protein [Candidatus Nitrosotalea sp.]|nr:HEAT repeat domain-containing protein [Candidatus Nitrosotalea sp.]